MIDKFLRSGNLGPLRLGLSRSEVRRLLGEEIDHSQRSWKNEIWKYHNLQVTFIQDELHLIGLYFEDGDQSLTLPQTLLPEGRVVFESTSISDVEQRVLGLDLHFAVIEDLTFDDQRVILIEESGVNIVFYQGKLTKMLLSQH